MRLIFIYSLWSNFISLTFKLVESFLAQIQNTQDGVVFVVAAFMRFEFTKFKWIRLEVGELNSVILLDPFEAGVFGFYFLEYHGVYLCYECFDAIFKTNQHLELVRNIIQTARNGTTLKTSKNLRYFESYTQHLFSF